jgi:hypothetical protein
VGKPEKNRKSSRSKITIAAENAKKKIAAATQITEMRRDEKFSLTAASRLNYRQFQRRKD